MCVTLFIGFLSEMFAYLFSSDI